MAMSKNKLLHPLRTWHWRFLLKSNIKLDIDPKKMLPREQGTRDYTKIVKEVMEQIDEEERLH